MKNQVIPLFNFPNNTYNIVVEIDGKNKTFNLFYSYNLSANYWTLDIREPNSRTIAGNLPLLSGHNLLEGLEYLNLGELYLFRNSDLTPEIPSDTNLDSGYILLWRA